LNDYWLILSEEQGTSMESRQLYFITVVQIVAVGMLLWVILTKPSPWDLQREIGTALVIAGICGIATARRQLGRSFAIKAAAHKLVTRGVYSKIRNPIYVFGMLLVAGLVLVLVLHRPLLWLLFLALAVMQTVRAHREAQVLEAAFGDEYREYRRKTWF
jgi:protein-S-isoprenylcysteine O-methyltransferase Ste14